MIAAFFSTPVHAAIGAIYGLWKYVVLALGWTLFYAVYFSIRAAAQAS